MTFIDRKRQNRQSRITAVNDQQQSTLAQLEEEDAAAEEQHQQRLAGLHEEIRLALFKRSGLKEINWMQIFSSYKDLLIY